jgi:cytochrome c
VTNAVKLVVILACLCVAGVSLSTIHPFGNPRSGAQLNAPLLEGSDVPESARTALETKCGDCHSEKTRYPLYSHLAPISWMIDRDVLEGREKLDMSRWQLYNVDDRITILSRMASEVHASLMPPRTYVLLHPHARLSSVEEELVYDWAKSERKNLKRELGNRSDQSSAGLRMGKP